MRLVISLKKDGNANVIINQLWQYTPLQTNVVMMNVVLVNRVPKTLGLRQLIDQFIEHRKVVIRRRTMYLLRKARQRAHVLEGLILAVADIDEIIRIIRQSPDVPAAREALMRKPLRLSEQATVRKLLPEVFVDRAGSNDQFLTHTQADAILAMQLRRLTGLEIEQLAKEYGELVEQIADYELILSDEKRVLDIISEDMHEMRDKYADERRTEITGAVDSFAMEDLIAKEDVVVTLSHEGYIKRVPLTTYREQGRGGRGIKGTEARDGDFIEHLRVVSTHDYLLFFTDRGRVYWLKVYDIPSLSRTSRGRALPNVLTMQPDERHMVVLPVSAFEENFVAFATERGVIKKTPLSAFSRPRPSGIQAITLEEGDSLIGAWLTNGENEIILGTRNGMACRFNEDDVRAMGRTARGVRGIDLRDDDKVVDMVVIEPGMSLLTVCEQGYGKRTPVEDYRLTKRGGKGVINIKTTDRNGPVVALRAVDNTYSVMMITEKGILIRIKMGDIREIGRATQGVRLMRLDRGDRVVAVGKLAIDEDVPESETAADGDAAAGPADASASNAAGEADSTTPSDDAGPDDSAAGASGDPGEEN